MYLSLTFPHKTFRPPHRINHINDLHFFFFRFACMVYPILFSERIDSSQFQFDSSSNDRHAK